MRKLTLFTVLAVAAAAASSSSAARAELPQRCTDNPAYANVRMHCFAAAALGGAGEGRVRFQITGSFRLRATTAVLAAVDAPGSTLRLHRVVSEDDVQVPPGPRTVEPPVGGKLYLARTLTLDGDCPSVCYLELAASRYAFSSSGSGEIDVFEASDSGAGIRSSLNERLLLGDRDGISDGTSLVFWGDAPYTNCNFTLKACQGTTRHGYLSEQPHRGRVIVVGRQTGLSLSDPRDGRLWNTALDWPFCGC